MTEPIPLSLIQSGVDLTEPRPLPTGGLVTWVQRWGPRSAIVGAKPSGGPVRLLSHGPDPAPGRGTSGGCYTWTGHGASMIYAASGGGLWLQPTGGGAGRMLADGDCRAPAVDHQTAQGTSTFVVYVVDEARVMFTDLEDGESRRLDDGRHAFCFDPAVSPDGGMVSWMAWSPPDMPWNGAVRVDHSLADGSITVVSFDGAAIQQPRFAPDGTPTAVNDASGWLNVVVGDDAVVDEPVEHAGPTWGMGQRSYDISPDGTLVAFTRNERGFGRLTVADRATGEVEDIGRGVHGHVVWMPDATALVAVRSGARTPTEIVVYRRDDGSWSRRSLAVGPNGGWVTWELPEPELVEAEAADGSRLHARRYAAGTGRLLCWVHGGPTDQWQVDWRPRISYWWSRGWDVLVVDPRGTTGHGRDYQRALDGAWGRVDVDDTADLIAAAHGAGWASPATTVVIGGSSGGLTTLGVLADHGHLVCGGVTSYPVSDLLALTESTHRFEAHYTDTLVADDAWTELSVINRAQRIRQPLLVFHGTDDEVVPIGQSRELVERIRAGGGADVEFVEYEGEGHGFRDPANVADEYERTERFLDRLTASRR